MDLTSEYIDVVLQSKLIQELWVPSMFQLVSDKKKRSLYWLGQRIYNDHDGDLSSIKDKVLWVPQGGEIFSAICVYHDKCYLGWESKKRVEFNDKIMNSMYSTLREERTRYANWDLFFNSREKRDLYYFFKYIEGRDFPGISLLSTN